MQYEKILYLYPIKRYSKTVVGPGVSSTYFTSHSSLQSGQDSQGEVCLLYTATL